MLRLNLAVVTYPVQEPICPLIPGPRPSVVSAPLCSLLSLWTTLPATRREVARPSMLISAMPCYGVYVATLKFARTDS